MHIGPRPGERTAFLLVPMAMKMMKVMKVTACEELGGKDDAVNQVTALHAA